MVHQSRPFPWFHHMFTTSQHITTGTTHFRQVAGGFARWQTNQHEFPALAARPRRAMYWLAPKVAHSCNPNVGWEDPAEATWAMLVGGDWETCWHGWTCAICWMGKLYVNVYEWCIFAIAPLDLPGHSFTMENPSFIDHFPMNISIDGDVPFSAGLPDAATLVICLVRAARWDGEIICPKMA